MNSELLKLALSQQNDGSPQLRTPQRTQIHESAILKLKGLPYDTSKEQVLEFFQGFEVKSVDFVYEPDGRPSGLAFAEFLSRDEAIRAMAKNGEFIGERYVKLLLVPRQEMEEQVRLGTIAIPGGAARARAGLLKRRGMRLPLHSGMPGMPGSGDMLLNVMPNGAAMIPPHAYNNAAFSSQVPVREMFPENFLFLQHLVPSHMPKAMHQGLPMQPQMIPQGQMTMQPHMQPHMQSHMQPHMQPHMRMSMQPQLAPALGMHTSQLPGQVAPGQMYPHSSGASTGIPSATPQMPPTSAPAPSTTPPAGGAHPDSATYAPSSNIPPPASTQDVKTLKIRGLPFRVTPAELMQFFWGYEFIPESLAFGKDALGRPSGEAWLTFVSHEEAVRAVAERNRRYLRNRYLELSLWHG